MSEEILIAAAAWLAMRDKLLALPIRAPDYLKHLNDLSEAEDMLAKAVRKGMTK